MSEPEFYPMPMFVTLCAQQVDKSAQWYQDALGFRSVYVMPGEEGVPQMVHLRLGRYQDLILVPDPPGAVFAPGGRGRGITINLSHESGIDALAERARAAGAHIVAGPVDRPWNVRELTVQDPDGYQLAFSQVIDATRDFDDVMGAASTSQ